MIKRHSKIQLSKKSLEKITNQSFLAVTMLKKHASAFHLQNYISRFFTFFPLLFYLFRLVPSSSSRKYSEFPWKYRFDRSNIECLLYLIVFIGRPLAPFEVLEAVDSRPSFSIRRFEALEPSAIVPVRGEGVRQPRVNYLQGFLFKELVFLNGSLISCCLGGAPFSPRNRRVDRVVYYISSIEGGSPRSISASVHGIISR